MRANKATACHLEALLLVAEVSDPSVAELQSKIASFQSKQRKQTKHKNKYYDWIHTRRMTKNVETALSRQIVKSSANVMEYLQKGERHGDGQICDIDSHGDISAKNMIRDDIARLRQQPHAEDHMSLIAEVRSSIEANRKSTPEDEARQGYALCADLLLDLKERLSTSIGELDTRYSDLLAEAKESRQTITQLLSDDPGNNYHLPQPLLKAFKSLRAVLPNSDEDEGQIHLVELLENELKRDLLDAHDAHNSALTLMAFENKPTVASQEFKKKCQEIINSGLKEIELLRIEFKARSKRIRANIDTELTHKETNLRLQSMYLEQGNTRKSKMVMQLQAVAKSYEKEATRTKRMLEAKQTIVAHQTQQIESEKGTHFKQNLRDDFSVEIENLKHQHANRERTMYRQEQTKHKIRAQKRAEASAIQSEEIRLERLNSLAASVPYAESIIGMTSDIHKSTEARKNDVYVRSDLADFQSGKLKSFTERRIFSDSNFRLGNALHKSGLAQSAYARDVVRNAIPRTTGITGIRPY